MPENNQAQDAYNPPAITNNDFDETRFSDIELDDLFWLENVSDGNNPTYRKITESEAGNTKTRTLESFNSTDVVYQRT